MSFSQINAMATRELVKMALIASLLLLPSVWAQDNDPQVQADDADQTSEKLEASSTPSAENTDVAQSNDGEFAVADEINDPDNPAAQARSRFIPTEEISQDLGVSFPIDI